MSEHHTWDTTTPNGAANNRGHSAPEALESLVPAPEPAPAALPVPPPLPRRATQLSSDSPAASPLSESSDAKTTSGPQKTGGEIEKPIRGPGNSRGPLRGSVGSKPRNPNKTKGVKARKADRLSRLLPMIVKGMSHRAMAVAVGSSKVQVTRDVRTLLDELTKSNHEAAERWQAVAVERLNQLVSVWWDAAITVGKNGMPDPKAHAKVSQSLRELHRVQGLHLDTVVNMQTNVVMDAGYLEFRNTMLKLGDSGRYPGLKEEMAAAVMRAMGERNVGPGVNGGVPAGLPVDL